MAPLPERPFFSAYGYDLEIIKKKIKHVYFRVYPEKKKIVISAPYQVSGNQLTRMIKSQKTWLDKQDRKRSCFHAEKRKSYASGDRILYKGKSVILKVHVRRGRSFAETSSDHAILNLYVMPGHNQGVCESNFYKFCRQTLNKSIPQFIKKWEPVLGVTVQEFGIRRMKTRWGSCNINKSRIWLNLYLVHLADACLEYVIVHEMVHLLERNHNDRFKTLMDKFIPGWPGLKKQLDQTGPFVKA